MLHTLSSFEIDVLYAIIARYEGAPLSGGVRDYFDAFDGTLDIRKRFTLVTPAANTLRLFYNKAALPSQSMPREEFKSLCVTVKERLLQTANFIIKLEQQKLIIPEYKIPEYIQPTQKEALPWRVYNEFFPDEASSILYVKSFNPIPSKELYALPEPPPAPRAAVRRKPFRAAIQAF